MPIPDLAVLVAGAVTITAAGHLLERFLDPIARHRRATRRAHRRAVRADQRAAAMAARARRGLAR